VYREPNDLKDLSISHVLKDSADGAPGWTKEQYSAFAVSTCCTGTSCQSVLQYAMRQACVQMAGNTYPLWRELTDANKLSIRAAVSNIPFYQPASLDRVLHFGTLAMCMQRDLVLWKTEDDFSSKLLPSITKWPGVCVFLKMNLSIPCIMVDSSSYENLRIATVQNTPRDAVKRK